MGSHIDFLERNDIFDQAQSTNRTKQHNGQQHNHKFPK